MAVRVLGVDPGLTRCGVGVVEGLPGRQLTMLGVGVVRTPAEDEIGPRLLAIEQGLESWLDRYSPELVAVERVFAQHNVRTVMGTAQASAVAVLCATRRGIPVTLHTPSEVKAAVTGSGRADKAQVTAMVTRLLRLDAPPKPADAADALALAICHIWRGGSTNRLTAAIKAHGPGGGSWHGATSGRNQGRGELREAEDAQREDPPEQRAAAPRAAYGRAPGRSRSSPRP